MCSRSVHEVHSLVSQIMSLHGLNKTTELLYCLATLFFALWTEGLLSPRSTNRTVYYICTYELKLFIPFMCRYHYFLFYSLNVLERSELRQSAQELKSAKITHSSSHTVGWVFEVFLLFLKVICTHPWNPQLTLKRFHLHNKSYINFTFLSQ